MAIYPGAQVKLIDTAYLSGKPLMLHNRVNLHVAAGNGSLYRFFNAPRRASSHFWVAKNGTVEQYVDTSLQAEADLEGNDATVSIETEGGTGTSADTDPWTDQQVNALADLCRWIMDTHGIRKVLAGSSKPGDNSWGQSWHRLGINGSFPRLPDIRAGRLQRGGGMKYSGSTGKVCPGGGKIQQIPHILDLVNGGTTQPQPKPPEPQPKPPSGQLDTDGMWGSATTSRAQQVLGTPVDGEVWYQYKPNAQPAFTSGWKYNYVKGKGSELVKAMQRGMGIKDDGVWGTATTKALQKRYGVPQDGELWKNSPTIKEFQRRLNNGTW